MDCRRKRTRIDGQFAPSIAQMRRPIIEAPHYITTEADRQASLIEALAKNVDDPIALSRGCKVAAKELGVTIAAAPFTMQGATRTRLAPPFS